ncbi:hypothetical protein [Lishizhenia sp.]|uniref:hypothetical protein n=1 Tax=Lishizhenia sp. TaxID=2497594 RepID=UPI00299DFF87|nr:hypothetical protein [Lishizhenia sp.]MDX1445506.1 hypothetical protein [Lishizhenia sp.]
MGDKYVTTLEYRSMTLWEDLKRGGSDISLDGGESFQDLERGIRFSCDEIYDIDQEYYKETYPEISGKDDGQFMLNVAVHLKRAAMYANQVSVEQEVKGRYGTDVRYIIVRGKENSYSDNLCFIYATSLEDKHVCLFQFVCKENDLKYYFQEFMDCLASIRR